MATIAETLGLRVEQHDDGRQPGMYDLNFTTADGRTAAVEVTAAADAASIQLWKLVNARDERWIVPTLKGGWMMHLRPTARARRLIRELPALLAELENRGLTEVPGRWDRGSASDSIGERVQALGVVSGRQGGTAYPGSVYLTIDQPLERTGGVVDSTGTAVPGWVRTFLLDPHQTDVLAKLARSGAVERHAFILVPAFSTAPFGVVDMLWRDRDDVVPAEPPDLPREVTHIWLMTFWAQGSGLRWSPRDGWERFNRQFRVDA